jgi:hypothetical protein
MSSDVHPSGTSSYAIAALGLGVLAILLFPFALSFLFQGGWPLILVHIGIAAVAIGCARRGMDDTRRDRALGGRRVAIGGLVLGILGVAVWPLLLLSVLLLLPTMD